VALTGLFCADVLLRNYSLTIEKHLNPAIIVTISNAKEGSKCSKQVIYTARYGIDSNNLERPRSASKTRSNQVKRSIMIKRHLIKCIIIFSCFENVCFRVL